MKKFVLLIGVIISVVCQMNVMAKTVSITVHRKGNADRSTTVCRRPINLPIDVVYDKDKTTRFMVEPNTTGEKRQFTLFRQGPDFTEVEIIQKK